MPDQTPGSPRGLDALDRWDGSVAPGGWVCDVCGLPVESEPCREHQPGAYAEMQAESAALSPSVSTDDDEDPARSAR